MSAAVPAFGPPPPVISDHDLLCLIGRGSYGEVWLARNVMGTFRAVKIVHRHTFERDKPFEREFEGIRKYEPVSRSHEGLVQILHVGRSASPDCFYYVMELADDARDPRPEDERQGTEGSGRKAENGHPKAGLTSPAESLPLSPETYHPKTLRNEIRRLGRIPLHELLPLGLSLTSALGHLHKQGLIHRDLKPSNIIFVRGHPKIADIGLVSELGESHSFVGTEGFVPPEGPGTRQADLYSLGKLLYEASTGKDRLSFPEIPEEWLGPPPRRDLLEFHEVTLKACEGRPDRRYARAEEAHADLALLQSGRSVRHLHQMERRVAFLSKAGLVAGAVAVLALIGYLLAAREARIERGHLEEVKRTEQQARKAEQEMKAALQESLLMQARAGRRSGLAGCRLNSLEAVGRAAAATNFLALRNEAIACLALVDLRIVRSVPTRRTVYDVVRLDRQLEHFALIDPTAGVVSFRRLSDGEEAFALRRPKARGRFPPSAGTNHPCLTTNFVSDVLLYWERIHQSVEYWPRAYAPPHIFQAISSDGRRLAVVNPKGALDFYETTNGAWLGATDFMVYSASLAFSPSGQQLAVCLRPSNSVAVLSVPDGAIRASLPNAQHGGGGLAWHSDGRTLAVPGADFSIRLWDTVTGKVRHILRGHQDSMVAVDFHPDKPLLASSSLDGTIRLWDSGTGQLLVTLPSRGFQLRFSPDGRRLAFLHFDHRIVQIWEVVADRVCRSLGEPALPEDERSSKGFWTIDFSADERLLVAVGAVGLRVWDLAGVREAVEVSPHGWSSAFWDPSDRSLIVSDTNGLVRWPGRPQDDPDDLTLGPPELLVPAHGPPSFGRGSRSRGADTLTYVQDNEVTVWKRGGTKAVFRGTRASSEVVLSTDDRWLAVVWFLPSTALQLKVFDLATSRLAWTTDLEQQVRLAFSPDARWLVSGSGDEYCFWDVSTGQPGRRIPRQNPCDREGPLAFSPDGRLLAIALNRTTVQLLDAATGQALGSLESPMPRNLTCLAFSPSGTQLAAATEAHVIELWDLRKLRRQLAELKLDWDQPPYPLAPTNAPTGPLRVRFVQ